MSIPGVESRYRLPRLGKIRLGEEKAEKPGWHPRPLDHFRLDDVPWVREVYPDPCRELDVMFPLEDLDVFFPQGLKAYKAGGLWCQCSDNQTATRVRLELGKDAHGEAFIAEQGLKVEVGHMYNLPCPHAAVVRGEEVDECPYYASRPQQCKAVGRLLFLLPKVPRFGVYEIATSAEWTSIPALNAYIECVRAAAGRISMIPLKLRLVSAEFKPRGMTQKKRGYVLELVYEGRVDELQGYAHKRPLLTGRIVAVPTITELDEDLPEDLFPQAAAEKEKAAATASRPAAVEAARERLGGAKTREEPPAEPKAVKKSEPEKPLRPTPAASAKPQQPLEEMW